ncbi:DUF859 family phage minor structural protein [Streptococcus suis]|uniref:DUF859 family phage minor structural protein n=1 Tax=Streptococcus suis TaxID=1307 RepID=UPI0005CDB744|nr:DUF859 family phage minor structural protein [Streptococcus suis]NQF93121.1 hypothetical protein [Streptococcus suis]NQH06202.1 hypothetical protein [Streptococcus suis]NQH13786.1 hypothetical protein [Streptococcus suis]NQQ19408.1 hypothetical protein [Streptococcus suis]NQQ42695.1 hypothetical protein [Streptococcus suis]
MAKFSGASGSLYLNVYIEPSTQNIANNTTIVNWRMTVSRTGAYYTYNEDGDSTLSLDLNGSRVHSSNPRWRTSGEEFQMASGSTTVGHNADGTKSFGFSATFNPNNGLHGVIKVSGNVSLKTIPRSSSISFSTGTIGSPLAITINRASTSFTHTLRWAWGSRSGTIASGLTTSASWTIPMDFCNELPNNVSGTGTIYVDTYSGSTKIGTQSKQFTANVPSSVIPTFTGITLDDQNAIAKALITGNTFVQIMSNIKVTFNGASGIYNSTIKGFRAEVLNRDIILTSNGGTLGPMNFNGTATIRASVTDSRGRVSATKDVTITLLEYYAPVISIQVLRTRENPNTIQVLRTIKVAPLSFGGVYKNSTKLVFEVAQLGSTSYVVDTGSAGGEWTTIFTLTNSEANLGGTYDSTSSWTVRAKLSDKFTSSNPTIASTNVGTETVINACDKDGRFGVGKIPELGPAGSLDVAGDIYAGGKRIQQYQLTSNDGRAIRASGDWNNYGDTGFYMGYNMKNQPSFSGQHSWKYIRVMKHNDIYCAQESIDFNGVASAFRVKNNSTWSPWKEYATTDHPLLQEKPLKTLTMGFPYGLNATLTRKDNLVTISLNRRITNIDVFEYRQMIETIPLGYRPTAEAHMVIVPNSGSFTKSPSILHFASDGKIRLTNGTGGAHVYTGTITYITNDPYPS